MNVLTIVGARPQFIKASPVSIALPKAGHKELASINSWLPGHGSVRKKCRFDCH